ncbi:hypothetical protein PGT21_007821 [Puccinia graminis f. sp. tritici]|uniref:RING-type domain-containing protein n=1 Tax=Puccinia graminis f. sp. tritici TaxID=56615 RepID=A0A5B0MKE1_PUCGR|nr:hypothetical protein PGT21_007821 [Puccinia graminis f. sp. tritici]KAA1135505.1 hypothetical protein PGTUg99_008832 [Puccinia graminis f. sp. tritici]
MSSPPLRIIDPEPGRAGEPGSAIRCGETGQDPMASLDAVARAVADARRALQELHHETSTLQLISAQLHRHALLLRLIHNAMALSLQPALEPPHPSRQSTLQRLDLLDSSGNPIHTLASVEAFKSNPEHNQQIPHCLICLEDYILDSPIVVLPCHHSHNFHLTCLTHWARYCQQLLCPLCRSPYEQERSSDDDLPAES